MIGPEVTFSTLPSGESFDDDGSVPNIAFVPFDLVFAQQSSQLLLESNLAMMLFLTGDVSL